jgi:hypothetical protein
MVKQNKECTNESWGSEYVEAPVKRKRITEVEEYVALNGEKSPAASHDNKRNHKMHEKQNYKNYI